MPIATRLLLLGALGFAGLLFACGGDDEPESTDTPTRTATPRTRTPTRTDGPASPTDDELKSPPVDETPNGGGPTATADGGPQPTPAREGTPAVAPTDQTAYLDQFRNRNIIDESCTYDPRTFVVDCPNRGRFAIDPVLGGQDISCTLGVVEGNPEYINCQSVEPRQAIYYEIQG